MRNLVSMMPLEKLTIVKLTVVNPSKREHIIALLKLIGISKYISFVFISFCVVMLYRYSHLLVKWAMRKYS